MYYLTLHCICIFWCVCVCLSPFHVNMTNHVHVQVIELQSETGQLLAEMQLCRTVLICSLFMYSSQS